MMKMIKKYVINKITVTSMCLFLLFMFYIIPINEEININTIDNNIKKYRNIVYLLDEDNYVSKVVSFYDKNNIEDVIRWKINVLMNGIDSLSGFYSLIPKSVKLNSISVKKDSVYLDFSKEILNVSIYLEEEMIEAIVFSLCEINGINNIYISVEGEKLISLPNSKKQLPYPLTKEIGINKEYDIDSLNDIKKTTVVFHKEKDNVSYYVPVTKINNSKSEKIDIIIEELKSGVNSQNNLNGLVSDNLVLEKYEFIDSIVNLFFNDIEINDEVKSVISESIFENYDVNEIIFNISDVENDVKVFKN